MAALILLIMALIFIIAQFFFLFQVTEVGIHILGSDLNGFMVTSNFWAWVVVFLLLAVATGVLRFVFRLLNVLVGAGIALLINAILKATSRTRRYGSDRERASISLGVTVLLIWTAWVIASFYLTAGAMNFFDTNPHLNTWLADGNWVAHALTYISILGIVYPSNSKD